MKAYIRIDPLIDERKGHYTPAQLGAYLMVLCKAARQADRGRFRSEAALRNMVPAAYVKVLPFLYSEGDLVVKDDGSVYVDGWDEWQEGDLTVGERMARMRNRKRNAGVTGTVTPTVTRPYRSATTLDVDSYVDVDGSKEPSTAREKKPDAASAFYDLQGGQASPKALKWVDELAQEYGNDAVISEMARHTVEGRVDLKATSSALALADLQKRKDNEARAKSRAVEELEEARRNVEAMTPEQKARIEALKAQMGGLVKEMP